MQKRVLPISVTVLVLIIGAAVVFLNNGSNNETLDDSGSDAEVLTYEGDTQYINMKAQNGYKPGAVTAKADMKTVIRMSTKNTFDCSTALVIPALDYQAFLEPTGTEEIEIPFEKAKGKLQGLCSMGMYGFTVEFQ